MQEWIEVILVVCVVSAFLVSVLEGCRLFLGWRRSEP
jgi:hypothetical protein